MNDERVKYEALHDGDGVGGCGVDDRRLHRDSAGPYRYVFAPYNSYYHPDQDIKKLSIILAAAVYYAIPIITSVRTVKTASN